MDAAVRAGARSWGRTSGKKLWWKQGIGAVVGPAGGCSRRSNDRILRSEQRKDTAVGSRDRMVRWEHRTGAAVKAAIGCCGQSSGRIPR